MLSKKGITPLIAVVLLMMMAVASVGVAFYWLTRMQQQAQEDELCDDELCDLPMTEYDYEDYFYNQVHLTSYLAEKMNLTVESLDAGVIVFWVNERPYAIQCLQATEADEEGLLMGCCKEGYIDTILKEFTNFTYNGCRDEEFQVIYLDY